MEKVKSFANQNENVLSEMSSALNNITKMNIDNQNYRTTSISAINSAAAKIEAMPTPEDIEESICDNIIKQCIRRIG